MERMKKYTNFSGTPAGDLVFNCKLYIIIYNYKKILPFAKKRCIMI